MIRSTDTLAEYEEDGEDHNDLDKDAQQKLQAPPNWDGPIHQRRCTDTGCLLFFILALVVYACIGIYAAHQGDARVIVYPMDYDGNICGLDYGGRDMTDYPFLYYVNTYTGGVCVEKCPHDGLDMRTLITYDGIWQAENATLPPDFLKVADYSSSENVLSCTTNDCYPNNNVQDSWTSTGIDRGLGYAYYVGDTYEMFQRCFLTSDSEVAIRELTGTLTTKPINVVNPWETHAFWTNFYGDLWTARWVILGFGFGVALMLSLIYVGLMRIPCLLNGLIWTSIVLVTGSFAVAGFYAYSMAEEWSQDNPFKSARDEQIKYTKITSFILLGISILCVLFACCFRSSIQTAVQCVRESGRAINRMVMLFGVPVLQGLLLLAFWTVFVSVSANLASLGEVTTRTFPVDLDGTLVSMRVFEFNDFIRNCGWYLLFIFFWVASFVLAIGDMTVALSVSRWYFTISKRDVNSSWVLGSLGTTLRFHMGTLAFGSLLIAIVRLLRAILIRVQRTVKSITNEKVANMLLCCCQCGLCCLERILKFINKNAYIQCAIFGTPFVESGRQACFLIVRHAARVGSLSYISWAVFLMGKLLISILSTVAAYYTLVEYESQVLEEALYSNGGPIFLIFCISFFMATMFMGVFDTSILTVLHCFAADEEMFQDGSKYTDKDFKKWVDEQEESGRAR